MIDWLTVVIPLCHKPLNSGAIMSINPDGSLDWETPRRLKVRGSHQSAISVKSIGGDGAGNATELYIDGNPSKFLQGHNVFGSDDVQGLIYETIQQVLLVHGLVPTDFEEKMYSVGAIKVKRIDINYSYSLNNRSDVRAWLRGFEFTARSRAGRLSSTRGTVYAGKHSRRWSLKAYCKADEIELGGKGHKLADGLPDSLIDWADNKLRIEVVLRSKELEKLGLTTIRLIEKYGVENLYSQYVSKIDMSKQITLTGEQVAKLPQVVKSTYMLWMQGADIREVLTRATFYRHRNILLESDIDINCIAANPKNNVVPLIRVLEAKPANVPDWARNQKLVYFR